MSIRSLQTCFLTLVSSLMIACSPQSSKLQLYYCKDSSDVGTCSGSCKPVPEMAIEFMVDAKKSYVMQTIFDNGKQSGSELLKNCKVIDDRNWSCETFIDLSPVGSRKHTHLMSNGRYQDLKVTSIFGGSTTEFGLCGK